MYVVHPDADSCCHPFPREVFSSFHAHDLQVLLSWANHGKFHVAIKHRKHPRRSS